MKKLVFAFILSVSAASSLGWSREGRGAEHGSGGREIVVQGELVDMSCYMAHEGKGPKHADCAKTCVLGGAPLGLLGAAASAEE